MEAKIAYISITIPSFFRPSAPSFLLIPHHLRKFAVFVLSVVGIEAQFLGISLRRRLSHEISRDARKLIWTLTDVLKTTSQGVGMSIQSTSNLHEWSARDVARRRVLDFDLNYPPPDECIDPTGPYVEEAWFYNHFQRQGMDNPQFVDEDIAIISPRKFAEARKNFRRNHFQNRNGVRIRLNGDAGVHGGLTVNYGVSAQEQTVHNLELRLCSESSSQTRNEVTDVDIPSALGQSRVPAAAPSLRCAICIEPLVEETSTKCGHIFCKNCIEAAIAAQHRCPICRRKLRKRDIIRIYLPFSI